MSATKKYPCKNFIYQVMGFLIQIGESPLPTNQSTNPLLLQGHTLPNNTLCVNADGNMYTLLQCSFQFFAEMLMRDIKHFIPFNTRNYHLYETAHNLQNKVPLT